MTFELRVGATSVSIRPSTPFVGGGWVSGEQAAASLFGIRPRSAHSDTPWLDLAVEALTGSKPPPTDRDAGALRDAADRLRRDDGLVEHAEAPGVARIIFVVASRDEIRFDDGELELVVGVAFPSGDGHTACGVDIHLPVPLRRSGRDVREQIDGVVLTLPLRTQP